MSPDVFLHEHQIRYDGIGGLVLNSNPATYVASLKTLNALRYIDANGDFQDVVYETPGFVLGAPGIGSTGSALVNALRLAMQQYWDALKTGNLARVHAAVDLVNNYRMQGGYSAMVPISDFAILAENASNPVGELARFIISERQSVQESIERGDDPIRGSMVGSPLPWYDTSAAYFQIRDYGQQAMAMTNAERR